MSLVKYNQYSTKVGLTAPEIKARDPAWMTTTSWEMKPSFGSEESGVGLQEGRYCSNLHPLMKLRAPQGSTTGGVTMHAYWDGILRHREDQNWNIYRL
jgi:hypothetical protein